MLRYLTKRNSLVLVVGAGLLALGYIAGTIGIHATSDAPFCMVCHEMRIVAEQGWMRSAHFQNPAGVVAGCGDCHIPPELPHMIWTKARDGTKDVFAHLFGEADPVRMNWEHLRDVAREKVTDSSCMTCHQNLVPKGAPIKQIIAHRAYERLAGERKCTGCHTSEFHGKFKEYLFVQKNLSMRGGCP